MFSKTLVLFLFFAGFLCANQAKINLELSQGLRYEHVNFSISGIHGKPNILSELKFRHIEIYTTRLSSSVTKGGYYIKGMVCYGNIFNGKAVDDDYLLNNRKGQYSHSMHKISGDYTADFVLNLGKHFESMYDITYFTLYRL